MGMTLHESLSEEVTFDLRPEGGGGGGNWADGIARTKAPRQDEFGLYKD